MEAFYVHAADADKRAVGRLLRVALIGSVVLAVILLLLLAVASANTELFESQYPMLLWLTVGLAVALFVLVLELLRRLVLRYRRGDQTGDAMLTLVGELAPYEMPTLGILLKKSDREGAGVEVRGVVPGYAAADTGILPGDLIVACNDSPFPDGPN